jgi:hypothetical protein
MQTWDASTTRRVMAALRAPLKHHGYGVAGVSNPFTLQLGERIVSPFRAMPAHEGRPHVLLCEEWAADATSGGSGRQFAVKRVATSTADEGSATKWLRREWRALKAINDCLAKLSEGCDAARLHLPALVEPANAGGAMEAIMTEPVGHRVESLSKEDRGDQTMLERFDARVRALWDALH